MAFLLLHKELALTQEQAARIQRALEGLGEDFRWFAGLGGGEREGAPGEEARFRRVQKRIFDEIERFLTTDQKRALSDIRGRFESR